MSNYLRIIIENQEVDFANVEGFPISISYSLDAVEDVQKLSGYFTKRGVLLPANDKTRSVFGFFEEAGAENATDLEFKTFQIESSGLPVLWGKCRLRRADMKGGVYFLVGENYYVEFLGNNITWFEDLKKLKLKDLGFGVHTFDVATISSNINNTYSPTTDWGYYPIKMKEWTEEGKIMWNEFVPFLFIKSILVKIFESVGLELVSTFFDHEPIERLTLPVFLQQRYSKEFFLENTDVRAGFTSEPVVVLENTDNDLTFDDDSSGENFDNGNNYNTSTGEYTVPLAGRYRFKIAFDATFDGQLVGAYFVIFLNGAEVVPVIFNNQFGVLYESNINSVALNLTSGVVGQDITFKLRLGGHSGTDDIELSNVKMEVEMMEVEIDIGATVNFDYLLRDAWTADKFVLGLKHLFNLMIDSKVDEGKVYIEPMDRYAIKWKNSSGTVATIEGDGYFKIGEKTNKGIDIDLSKKARLQSNENKFTEYVLEYLVDDETGKGIDEHENLGLYSSRYNLNVNKHRIGEKRVKNPFFAKMVHILDSRPMADDSTVVPQFPLLWPFNYLEGEGAWLIDDDDADGVTGNYDYDLNNGRILYFAGQRGGIDGRIVNESDVNIDLPACFMVNYNDADDGDFSLSFGNELKLNDNRVLGLMHNFYLHYMKRLDEGKRFEGNMFWSDLEIMALDFRKKILMDNVNYMLKKINGWNPVGGFSTKTILEMDILAKLGDEDNVDNAAVVGYVSDEE